MLLNNQWTVYYIKNETRNYFEIKKNETITYQNEWNIGKTLLTEKFKAINVYFYKEQRSQVMNLICHPNSLKKRRANSI